MSEWQKEYTRLNIDNQRLLTHSTPFDININQSGSRSAECSGVPDVVEKG